MLTGMSTVNVLQSFVIRVSRLKRTRLFPDSERVRMAIPRDDEHFAGGNDRLAVVYPAWDDFLARVQLFARLRVEGVKDEVGHRRRAKLRGGQRRRGGGRGIAAAPSGSAHGRRRSRRSVSPSGRRGTARCGGIVPHVSSASRGLNRARYCVD